MNGYELFESKTLNSQYESHVNAKCNLVPSRPRRLTR